MARDALKICLLGILLKVVVLSEKALVKKMFSYKLDSCLVIYFEL